MFENLLRSANLPRVTFGGRSHDGELLVLRGSSTPTGDGYAVDLAGEHLDRLGTGVDDRHQRSVDVHGAELDDERTELGVAGEGSDLFEREP